MTIAVEPMVNAGDYEVRVLDNGWTVVTADGSLSAHYDGRKISFGAGVYLQSARKWSVVYENTETEAMSESWKIPTTHMSSMSLRLPAEKRQRRLLQPFHFLRLNSRQEPSA